MLLGCYRRGDANDPDIYVRAVASVLGEYPIEIIKAVCDPRFGLPSKSEWLPTVSEVKGACEATMAPIDRREREERFFADRRAALEAPVYPKRGLEDMQAKYAGLTAKADAGAQERQEARTARMVHVNDVLLNSEYAQAGIAPVEASAGIPVSLDLARKLGVRKLTKAKA